MSKRSAPAKKAPAKPAPKQQAKQTKPGPNSLRNQVLGMMGPKTRALYK